MKLSQKVKPPPILVIGDEKSKDLAEKRFNIKGFLAKIYGQILGGFYLNIKF